MSVLRSNEWHTTAGLQNHMVAKVASRISTSSYGIGVATNTWIPWPAKEMQIDVYPSSPSSRFLLMASITVASSSNGNSICFSRSGIPIGIGESRTYHPGIGAYSGWSFGASDGNHNFRTISLSYVDSPKSTGKISYDIYLMLEGGSMYLNRTTNYADGAQVYNSIATSNFTVFELEV